MDAFQAGSKFIHNNFPPFRFETSAQEPDQQINWLIFDWYTSVRVLYLLVREREGKEK